VVEAAAAGLSRSMLSGFSKRLTHNRLIIAAGDLFNQRQRQGGQMGLASACSGLASRTGGENR